MNVSTNVEINKLYKEHSYKEKNTLYSIVINLYSEVLIKSVPSIIVKPAKGMPNVSVL